MLWREWVGSLWLRRRWSDCGNLYMACVSFCTVCRFQFGFLIVLVKESSKIVWFLANTNCLFFRKNEISKIWIEESNSMSLLVSFHDLLHILDVRSILLEVYYLQIWDDLVFPVKIVKNVLHYYIMWIVWWHIITLFDIAFDVYFLDDRMDLDGGGCVFIYVSYDIGVP